MTKRIKATKALGTHVGKRRETRSERGSLEPATQTILDRAFIGSIAEDFGNRGESTITKSPMTNKQCQKHHKKDQTTANRMKVFFFVQGRNRGMATGILPREFYHFVSKANFRGKITVAIPRFLWSFIHESKHRHSIRRGLVFLMVLLPLFIPDC